MWGFAWGPRELDDLGKSEHKMDDDLGEPGYPHLWKTPYGFDRTQWDLGGFNWNVMVTNER